MNEQDVAAGYEAEVEALLGEARELVASLDDHQLNWRPAAHRWSVAQNLDHVVRTGRVHLPAMVPAAEMARSRLAEGRRPYRNGWVGGYLVRVMEPPPRPKVPTMKRLYPDEHHSGGDLLAAFEAFHAELLDLVRSTPAGAWRHARLRSPIMPLIRMTLGQAFAVLTGHGRRHLWQARQVTRAAGFPHADATRPAQAEGGQARAD